jgi:hypothetical protein
VQTTKNRTCHHSQMLRKTVPVAMQRHRQPWRWLRDAWPQGHMRTPLVIVWHPLVEETPQVVLGERDHKVQAFPPQRVGSKNWHVPIHGT